MNKKRTLAACVSAVVLAGLLTVPAMAHGHHGHRAQTVSYPQCPVTDCQRTSRHSHDGTTYCGHTLNDGHTHHTACSVEGCSRLGTHTHRGSGHGHHC